MTICIKCRARIDQAAHDMKRKIAEKLNRPVTPAKLCTDCAMLALLRLAFEDDDEEQRAKGGSDA